MKVYVLIQEDRRYDTAVTVFVDKAESIQTAASRIERDVNRCRKDDNVRELSVLEIAEYGVMTCKEVRGIERFPSEQDHFGLNDSMRDGDEPWVFYCNAYDDGPTLRVVETNLVK